ncbi:MAG: alpha/beta fold hydrolase [Burkholderiales bacterium]|nr:alpha/beta fold hydrolase [Burkholderiales bacterium]
MLETLSLNSLDGYALSARVYVPESMPRRVLLLVSAMGVSQRFYEPFAQWLTTQGVAVMTFDFRGIGDSAPRSLRGFDASISDWATKDLSAAVQYVETRWPEVPRAYLGHSLGGQLFGWLNHPERFDRVVTVASGNGYWRYNAPAVRGKAPLLWWLLAPVSVSLAGYFPGKRLGAIGDLPAKAMWQWRRWCLHPDYLGAEGGHLRAHYAKVRNPIHAVLAEDDELLSPLGIQRLYHLYSNAKVEFESIEPRAVGLDRVGHFGFFKPASATALWPKALSWIGLQA